MDEKNTGNEIINEESIEVYDELENLEFQNIGEEDKRKKEKKPHKKFKFLNKDVEFSDTACGVLLFIGLVLFCGMLAFPPLAVPAGLVFLLLWYVS